MIRIVILMFLVQIGISACGDQKKPVAKSNPLEAAGLFQNFPVLKLPFTIVDSNLHALNPDTTTISKTVFSNFLPDSVMKTIFQSDKDKISPIGKYEVKNNETYLVIKKVAKASNALYLIVFNKNQKFSAFLPLIELPTKANEHYTATIDNKLGITINKDWKEDDEALYSKVIYAYNNAGLFSVVMTETNDQSKMAAAYINPFDTLPKLNKYSGDFIKGKRSIISIRDGKSADAYLFFIHFENTSGDEECNGELRGEFSLNTPNSAIFSASSDPCVIEFSFAY